MEMPGLDTIQLKNFKSFKEQEFSLHPQFTLIIGNNGTGKTTLLEGLSVGLGGYLAGLGNTSSRNIFPSEVRIERSKIGDATVTLEAQYPCEVICHGTVHDVPVHWRRAVTSSSGRTSRGGAADIIRMAREYEQKITQHHDHQHVLPVLSYQSAGRLFSQKREKWYDSFEKEKMSRYVGYTDCLDTESNIKLFTNWLRKMTFIQLQKQKEIGELNAVLHAVKLFMKSLNGQETSLFYDVEEQEVMVNIEDNVFPLRLMSSGYRSVVGMAADIAYRMALLNPQLRSEAAAETPGVVLIDEIDLHLHPKWQWRIIESLRGTFPKVQFVATTHAPIVVASCKDYQMIQMGEEMTSEVETPFGWTVEDTLMEFMGVHNRSKEMELYITEVERLFRKKLKEELAAQEQKRLEELTRLIVSQLPESDPAVTSAKLLALKSEAMRKAKYEKD